MSTFRRLGSTVGALGLFVSTAAHAAPAVPPRPSPVEVVPMRSVAAIATPEGGVAVVIGTEDGKLYFEPFVEGRASGTPSELTTSGASLAIDSFLATGGREGGYVVTTLGEAVTLYRLGAEAPRLTLVSRFQRAASATLSLSAEGDSTKEVPLVSAHGYATTEIRAFGTRSVSVIATPDNPLLTGAAHPMIKGGLFVAPAPVGARLTLLGVDGAPTSELPIELEDTAPAARTAIVGLGAEALVAQWPSASGKEHGPIVHRIAAGGQIVERRELSVGIETIVADAPNAWLLRRVSGTYEVLGWNESTGPAPVWRSFGSVMGELRSAVCAARGCLYIGEGTSVVYPYVWIPRGGAPVEGRLAAPTKAGAPTGGTGYSPRYGGNDYGYDDTYSSSSSGCTTSPGAPGASASWLGLAIGAFAWARRSTKRRAES